MRPTVDAYEGHCLSFKNVYVVGERGVGIVLEGVNLSTFSLLLLSMHDQTLCTWTR